ncbi:MAG: TaqI-like C-terminal specificity domain-containing protein [Brevinema sp.]
MENKRLVCQGISGINDKYRLIFGIVDANIGLGNSANYMVIKENVFLDIFYMMGLLNSELLNWLFKARSTNSHTVVSQIRRLPIVDATPEQQAPIIDLVKKCMNAKAQDKNADISAYQKEIDTLVYALYGLSEDEITTIEMPTSTGGA